MQRIVALLTCLLLAPTLAAQEADTTPDGEPLCIILFEPSDDFSTMHVTLDLLLTDQEMANTTADVDRNNDGVTSASEVRSYQQASHQNISAFGGDNYALLLDDDWASNIHVWTKLLGFEGKTEADPDRLVQEHRLYTFQPANVPSHVFRGGQGAERYDDQRPVIEYVIVKAPDDWLVTWVNGEPYNDAMVELPSFSTWNEYSFTFETKNWTPTTGQGIPPLPFAFVGLALIVAGIFMRRPKQQ